MECTSEGMAKNVAKAGFAKMAAQGYTVEFTSEGLYTVTKPATEDHPMAVYMVLTDDLMVDFADGEFCACGFAKANKDFKVCKHLLFVQATIEAEIARIDADAQAAQDYADYLAGLEDGEGWPVCPYHGEYEATESGRPYYTCQRCERFRFP